MSVFHNNALIGAGGGAAADAAPGVRSLRFNTGDSAYLSRTPSSAGNRRTWTWAGWVKRNKIDTGTNQEHALFVTSDSGGNSDYVTLYFNSSGYINTTAFQSGSVQWSVKTAQVFRDPGAWMHIVWAVDLSQSTASDRVKLYLNGSQITDFITETYPSTAFDTRMNSTNEHSIGRASLYDRWYASFQLADIYFVDGLQLTPTSFGSTDSNGVWQRGTYSGTYGTNGFHLLDFENESTIGDDSSGNSNDFTANNLSDTAGVGNDVLLDFPANGSESDTGAGGEVSGNYCTWNPLRSGATFSNGNLDVAVPAAHSPIVGTIGVSSGKWYAEFTATNVNSAAGAAVGVAEETISGGLLARTDTWTYYFNGDKYHDGASASYGSSWTTNDVLGVAVDMDNGKIWFSKNGTFQASGDPAAGTNAAYTNLSGKTIFWTVGDGDSSNSGTTFVANFGQRSWEYTAPSGFKAMNTANLPTPTIADGSDYFDIQLYTGNGASTPGGSGSTQDFSNFAFAPSWVWIKDRTQSGHNHNLVDIVRGAPNLLLSDATNAEITNSTDGFTGFTSDGFTLGDNGEGTQSLELNKNGNSYVAWAWDAGSSTASNTDGSITASVRANQTAGFSIVKYTGQSGGGSWGHGLSAAPDFILFKRYTSAQNWFTWFREADGTYLEFEGINQDRAAFSSRNNVTATSTTITLPNQAEFTNDTSSSYIAYCFAPVTGYSAFGSYTGNASTDGPFVFTGMRPRWIMVKASDATGNWTIHDTARETYNPSDSVLYPNVTDAEYSNSGMAVDIVSNGFKVRTADSSYQNSSGVTYVYAAFAENPFQANGGLAR